MLKSKLQNLLSDLQANPTQQPSVQGFQASMSAQQEQPQEDPVAALRQMASKLGQHKAKKALEVAPVSNPVEGMQDFEAEPYQAPSLEEVQADRQAQQESLNQMVPEELTPDVEQVMQQANNLGQAKAQQASNEVTGAQDPMQGFNHQMNDQALAQALEQQKSDKRRNMMMGALLDSDKAAALSVGRNSTVDNTQFMKSMDEMANADLAGLQLRRKGMSEEEGLKQSRAKTAEDADLLAKADPNSGISKSVREFAKKMGFNPPESASVNQMQSILPLYERYQSRQDSLADKKQARADKLAEKSKAGTEGMTEGRKAADKDYAKDFNDFTGGGEVKAKDAINKLEELKTEMSKDTGLIQAGGGPLAGSLPDFTRSEKSIARRDNIVSTANSALKATFGGQLSDGERKALASEFYNDKLSNAENMKIIERKIKELKNGLQVQKAKAQHFAKTGTLTGFEGPKAASEKVKPKTVTQNGHVYTLNEATGEYE